MEDIESERGVLMEAKTEDSSKRVRHRKKRLLNQLLQQMEFYFSDANLTKDRFLRQLVEHDPFVDLNVFLRFNRVRALTTSFNDLVKAVSKSSFLTLSDDKTKVARMTPVREKENADECTVYVERLPPHADHDWLRTVFSEYGPVEYVSIPKYRISGKVKGFAFVEFDTPVAASRALQAFGAAGNCLPFTLEPENLCSIQTFEGNVDAETDETAVSGVNVFGKQDAEGIAEAEEGVGDEGEEYECQPKSKKSRTRSSDKIEGAGDEGEEYECQPKTKKSQKRSSDRVEGAGDEGEDYECQSKSKKSRTCSSDRIEGAGDEGKDYEGQSKSKKSRTRSSDKIEGAGDEGEEYECQPKTKKSRTRSSDRIQGVGDEGEENECQPKTKKSRTCSSDKIEASGKESVHSDKEKKKRKRSKSENAEDENIVPEKKEKLQVPREEPEDVHEESGAEKEGEECRKKSKRRKRRKFQKEQTECAVIGLQIMSKREWKRLRNKYLNLQKEKMGQLKRFMRQEHQCGARMAKHENGSAGLLRPERAKYSSLEYTPGVIVKFKTDQPVSSVALQNELIAEGADIAYVDVCNDTDVCVRCPSAEAAKQLLKTGKWEDAHILDGKEEKSYWDKIRQGQAERRQNRRGSKKRGKEKLLMKAEKFARTHIHFDD